MHMDPGFQPSPNLFNVTKITKTTRNEMHNTLVLITNEVFREKIILTDLKETWKPNSERTLEIFEQEEKCIGKSNGWKQRPL